MVLILQILLHFNSYWILFAYRYREKDLLKVSNYWFGPGELEDILEALEGIEESIVWGEYDLDTGNDRIHAAIKAPAGDWTADQIRQAVADRDENFLVAVKVKS